MLRKRPEVIGWMTHRTALQSTHGGDRDAFVTKLDPSGATLSYSTHLGRSDFDNGRGIAVETSGSAHIAGWAQSTDFPTANPWQAAYGGVRDGFVAKLAPQVHIDLKPGSFPNSINLLKSKGVIPVDIATTDTFDATTVDPAAVKFGPGEAAIAHSHGHLEDVDGDGDTDLLLHFRTPQPGIACGDTETTLTGSTSDEPPIQIEGSDSIKTVGCR